MRRSLSLSFSFMCAFLRQRKKERKNEEMFVEFFIGEELLKKPMRTYYFKCHLLSSESTPSSKNQSACGRGCILRGTEECARAREREVLTNQRASSSSPSFFFSREKVKKPMVHSYALFGFRWSLSDSKHAFYFFLTTFLAASLTNIFCKRRNKSGVLSSRHAGVCVGEGGGLSCWPRHDIFSTNAIIWCANDAFRERMQEQCAENDDDDDEEEFFLHQKQLLLLLAGERKKE